MANRMCISVGAETNEQAISEIKKCGRADIIELRADYIKNPNLKCLLKAKKPLIITNRKKSEGGFFNGAEEKRLALLKEAVESGASYVDIELSSGKKAISDLIKIKGKTKIIVSCHNFKETPDAGKLNKICRDIKKLNPDLIKIVTYADDISDNFRIFKLIKKAKKERRKIISFCMGEKGEISRVLTTAYGGFLTYAVPDKEKATAPGQLSVEELNKYNFKKLNSKTKVLGLVGNPVRHSRMPAIFNSAFRKNRMNYVYLRFPVEDVGQFARNFRKEDNFYGFGITIPHKEEVMKYIDYVDSTARKIGAVNTVVKRKGKLIGYNTDYVGAVRALKEKTEINGRKIVILGAGGAAKAVAYGIKNEGGQITILNRTVSKAEEIAKRLKCGFGGLDELRKIDYDILINCTSIGLKEGEMPVNAALLKNVVMDVVYSKTERDGKTGFLKKAEKRGCVAVSGLKMLIYQAEEQSRIWTGKRICLVS